MHPESSAEHISCCFCTPMSICCRYNGTHCVWISSSGAEQCGRGE